MVSGTSLAGFSRHASGGLGFVECFVGEVEFVTMLPNKRLKLAARVDYGMNLSSARRSLSAIR